MRGCHRRPSPQLAANHRQKRDIDARCYAKRGPSTDWDVHKLTGWERTTVNARRGPLCRRGIVVAVDKVKNEETGIVNTRWGLKG